MRARGINTSPPSRTRTTSPTPQCTCGSKARLDGRSLLGLLRPEAVVVGPPFGEPSSSHVLPDARSAARTASTHRLRTRTCAMRRPSRPCPWQYAAAHSAALLANAPVACRPAPAPRRRAWAPAVPTPCRPQAAPRARLGEANGRSHAHPPGGRRQTASGRPWFEACPRASHAQSEPSGSGS